MIARPIALQQSDKPMPGRKRRSGLAWIEVLVVTVAVALLIALLLPAFQQAKSRPRHNSWNVPFAIDFNRSISSTVRNGEGPILDLGHFATRNVLNCCFFAARTANTHISFRNQVSYTNGTVVALTPVSLYRCPRGVGLAALGGVLASAGSGGGGV